MAKKIELIDKSQEKECYICDGIGTIKIGEEYPYDVIRICKKCNGKGRYIEDHYLLITTQPDGQKICFDVDNGGK